MRIGGGGLKFRKFCERNKWMPPDVTAAPSLPADVPAALLSGSRAPGGGLLRLSLLLLALAAAAASHGVGGIAIFGGSGETGSLLQPLQSDEDVVEATERPRYPSLAGGVHLARHERERGRRGDRGFRCRPASA